MLFREKIEVYSEKHKKQNASFLMLQILVDTITTVL
jgi:hypothetical protein